MKASNWGFIRAQLSEQPAVVKADLRGKTVCVLGANTGIGFQACKHFASMNPGRMILACRSQARGQDAVARLEAETGYSKAELWIIDLGDFESVKRFGDKWEKDNGRLDILVANAAMETRQYTTTKDGWETTVQVNHLGISLAIILLVPTMLRTANEFTTLPRIVLVSSFLHHHVTIEREARSRPGKILKTLASKEYYTTKRMEQLYSVTKLINLFFARALTAHLGPSAPLIVNAVAPGFTVSELRRDIANLFLRVIEKLLALTTEEGSRRLVFAAVGMPNSPQSLKGQYIDIAGAEEPSDFVIGKEGQEVQESIWKETLAILGELDPRVTRIAERYFSTY
ncbi:hypothetical protein FB451DRAFT_479597 [Mycena latifolia]|nr:hypothetical protein FB451DRAFT_479597 [Mycena latifolia]